HAELTKPMYDRARAAIHDGELAGPFRIIGVYVGWRGRSVPGMIDYATFWGRKSAAERVGQSDFQEFMVRLKNAYEHHSAMPATEAAAYQRLHALGRQLRYGVDQTPVMLTLSADNDVPRNRLFKIGRIVGEWFTVKPRKPDPRERGMERQALGFFAEQVTHRL